MSGRRRRGKLYCCPSTLLQVPRLKGKGETPMKYSFPPSPLSRVEEPQGAGQDGWTPHRLVVTVEAPGPWDVRLAIHPDLPDDALPLLQPLSSLQLLRRSEDVHVQSPLEPAVPAGRQVRSGVRIIVAVAAVAVALPLPRRFFHGGAFAVSSAGHP